MSSRDGRIIAASTGAGFPPDSLCVGHLDFHTVFGVLSVAVGTLTARIALYLQPALALAHAYAPASTASSSRTLSLEIEINGHFATATRRMVLLVFLTCSRVEKTGR